MPKYSSFLLAAGLALAGIAHAQDIYRCGNEYTNNPSEAQKRSCKKVEGGNITLIQGAQPATPAQQPQARPAAQRPAGSSVDNAAQRARDSDARQILEAELKKAEARLSALQSEYNGGEPEKRGPEFRNHQMYLDRVAELKAGVERAQGDVDGIRREMARLPAPASR